MRPEAILLDVMLPDMTGYDVAKQFRNKLGLNATKTITVSGNPSYGEKLNGHGVDAALLKPVHVEELTSALGLAPRN